MTDDVSDLIDDLVQDTSDRFIVDDKGNFKSKFTNDLKIEPGSKSKRKSSDLVTALYDRDTNVYTQTPRNAQIKFAQEPSVEIYEVNHDESMRATGPRNSNGVVINPKYEKRLQNSRDNA
jgi:hypothetical protein